MLDLSNKEIGDRRVFYYDENGNEIILGDLTIGDVIMVYESSDSRVIDVHRSMKRVTGMIQRRETLDGTAGGTLHRQRGQASGRERRAVCRRDGQRSQRTDLP